MPAASSNWNASIMSKFLRLLAKSRHVHREPKPDKPSTAQRWAAIAENMNSSAFFACIAPCSAEDLRSGFEQLCQQVVSKCLPANCQPGSEAERLVLDMLNEATEPVICNIFREVQGGAQDIKPAAVSIMAEEKQHDTASVRSNHDDGNLLHDASPVESSAEIRMALRMLWMSLPVSASLTSWPTSSMCLQLLLEGNTSGGRRGIVHPSGRCQCSCIQGM